MGTWKEADSAATPIAPSGIDIRKEEGLSLPYPNAEM